VKSEHTEYAQQEVVDPKAVRGFYRVALPDGRIQLVKYRADENGFVTDVSYQGQATYPEEKNL
jgi:hypothetical protein